MCSMGKALTLGETPVHPNTDETLLARSLQRLHLANGVTFGRDCSNDQSLRTRILRRMFRL
jgi:hypothetical protein